MKNVTNKQKRGFADSLYHLLMTSPETGRRLGFWNVGNAPNGSLRIGIGTPDGNEFWMLDVTITESTEFEVKALKSHGLSDEQIEMLIQEVDGHKWPCVCGKPRSKEADLLCGECWDKIPVAKLQGFIRLDSDTEEHRLAAEQILRIAQRNLGQNTLL
jgi:hypothetical protein